MKRSKWYEKDVAAAKSGYIAPRIPIVSAKSSQNKSITGDRDGSGHLISSSSPDLTYKLSESPAIGRGAYHSSASSKFGSSEGDFSEMNKILKER
ncbi:hypothetical protein EYC80_009864 [Monilinia laxa]|uniref:Uncharacterized protein n=1 Tax=Monilinia laxa TaxID=61186 RepID=A0A5N6JQX2_MONLA|nr:hypothetical protein EYC80_009864 [Monilinia laxa]